MFKIFSALTAAFDGKPQPKIELPQVSPSPVVLDALDLFKDHEVDGLSSDECFRRYEAYAQYFKDHDTDPSLTPQTRDFYVYRMMKFLKRAVECKHPQAMEYYAACAYHGFDVKKDQEYAKVYYFQGAMSGRKDHALKLAYIYKDEKQFYYAKYFFNLAFDASGRDKYKQTMLSAWGDTFGLFLPVVEGDEIVAKTLTKEYAFGAPPEINLKADEAIQVYAEFNGFDVLPSTPAVRKVSAQTKQKPHAQPKKTSFLPLKLKKESRQERAIRIAKEKEEREKRSAELEKQRQLKLEAKHISDEQRQEELKQVQAAAKKIKQELIQADKEVKQAVAAKLQEISKEGKEAADAKQTTQDITLAGAEIRYLTEEELELHEFEPPKRKEDVIAPPPASGKPEDSLHDKEVESKSFEIEIKDQLQAWKSKSVDAPPAPSETSWTWFGWSSTKPPLPQFIWLNIKDPIVLNKFGRIFNVVQANKGEMCYVGSSAWRDLCIEEKAELPSCFNPSDKDFEILYNPACQKSFESFAAAMQVSLMSIFSVSCDKFKYSYGSSCLSFKVDLGDEAIDFKIINPKDYVTLNPFGATTVKWLMLANGGRELYGSEKQIAYWKALCRDRIFPADTEMVLRKGKLRPTHVLLRFVKYVIYRLGIEGSDKPSGFKLDKESSKFFTFDWLRTQYFANLILNDPFHFADDVLDLIKENYATHVKIRVMLLAFAATIVDQTAVPMTGRMQLAERIVNEILEQYARNKNDEAIKFDFNKKWFKSVMSIVLLKNLKHHENKALEIILRMFPNQQTLFLGSPPPTSSCTNGKLSYKQALSSSPLHKAAKNEKVASSTADQTQVQASALVTKADDAKAELRVTIT